MMRSRESLDWVLHCVRQAVEETLSSHTEYVRRIHEMAQAFQSCYEQTVVVDDIDAGLL